MKILSVDYGETKTGLAACDRTEFLCSPLGVLREKSMAKTAEKIVYTVREYEIGMIVIGLPVYDDGNEHPHAEQCKRLGGILENVAKIPVEYMEEDSSSLEAQDIMKSNGKKRKKRSDEEDAVAAALILERFLQKRNG